MSSIFDLRAVPYSVAASLCKPTSKQFCRYVGMRASKGTDTPEQVPLRADLDNIPAEQAALWRRINGSAVCCMMSDAVLKQQIDNKSKGNYIHEYSGLVK